MKYENYIKLSKEGRERYDYHQREWTGDAPLIASFMVMALLYLIVGYQSKELVYFISAVVCSIFFVLSVVSYVVREKKILKNYMVK